MIKMGSNLNLTRTYASNAGANETNVYEKFTFH